MLAKRGEDGVSLRKTLETVHRMTGRMPEQLVNQTQLPEQLSHVWEWYLILSMARTYRPDGVPQAIPESEIGWFFSNRRISPEGWETDALRMLDRAALDGLTE
jgi:hypothetical protein